jgi:lipopolysaccharide assembly protein A
VRFIYWSITALVALLVVVFAVSNRAMVTLALFPLPAALDAPLYLVVIAAVALGFLVGALVAWLGAGKHRRDARLLRQRIERLQRDVNKSLPTATAAKER